MDRIKALLREPALLIDAFESFIVVAIAMGLFSLSGDQQTNTIALFIAGLAVAKGALTQPFPVTLITDLGRAGLVFSVSLGLVTWTPDQVTVMVTFLGTLMTLIQRAQITPRYDPVAAIAGAGSGPVSGPASEEGYADVGFVAGVVLTLLGLLCLVLIAVGDPLLPMIWSIILLAVGLLVLYFSRGRTLR